MSGSVAPAGQPPGGTGLLDAVRDKLKVKGIKLWLQVNFCEVCAACRTMCVCSHICQNQANPQTKSLQSSQVPVRFFPAHVASATEVSLSRPCTVLFSLPGTLQRENNLATDEATLLRCLCQLQANALKRLKARQQGVTTSQPGPRGVSLDEIARSDSQKASDETPHTNIAQYEEHTLGFGSRMLKKMGFSGRLGKNGTGRAEPIIPHLKNNKLGLATSEEEEERIQPNARVIAQLQQSLPPSENVYAKRRKLKADVRIHDTETNESDLQFATMCAVIFDAEILHPDLIELHRQSWESSFHSLYPDHSSAMPPDNHAIWVGKTDECIAQFLLTTGLIPYNEQVVEECIAAKERDYTKLAQATLTSIPEVSCTRTIVD